ncbi:class I SAM-dependent methyltransferase [Sulfurimonas sp.]
MNRSFSELVKNKEKIVVELGPGERKCCKEAIGIDLHRKPSVEYVADLNQGLSFISSNSIDEIHAYHVLEHIDNLESFMREIYRVLKTGGRLIGSVPHFSNPYFYSDYTHNSFWGLYTLCYFSKNTIFKREVPKYYNRIDFRIEKIELVFTSPFRIRNKVKKIMQKIFNLNTYMQELYEENFVYMFPCYEIFFILRKDHE